MGEWREVPLGEVATHYRGYSYSSSELDDRGDDSFISLKVFGKGGGFREGGVKRIRAFVPQQFRVPGGSLLVANTDLTRDADVVGTAALVPGRFHNAIISMDATRVVPDPGQVNERYLALILGTAEARSFMRGSSAGSTVLHLDTKRLDVLPIRVPPLEEQRRIVEILDTIDETIQGTERVIAKLAMIRDGLRADLIDGAQDSWQPATLNDLGGMLTSGSRGWASYYAESGEVFLRIGNLTREHPNLRRLDETMFVQPPQGSEEQRTRCEPGDLLISITADLGIIGVIPSSIPRSYVNQHIARIRVNPDLANVRFVAHSLQSATGQQQFQRLNDSGAKAGLNLPAVGSLSLRVPALAIQRAVAGQIDEVQGLIDAERLALTKLRQTRSGLAADLLSGRVRTVAA